MLGSVLTQGLCFCLCVCVKPPHEPKEWKLLPGELECQQGPLRLTLPPCCAPWLPANPHVHASCSTFTDMLSLDMVFSHGIRGKQAPHPLETGHPSKTFIHPSIHPFRNYSLNANDMPDNTGTPVSQDILVLVPSPVQTSSSKIHFVWIVMILKLFVSCKNLGFCLLGKMEICDSRPAQPF